MGLEGKQDLPLANGRTTYVPKVNRMKGAPPHVLMVPYPAQPHILPLLNLARLLAIQRGLKITYVCHERFIDRLLKTESNWSDAIQFVGVPDKLPGFEKPSEFPDDPIVLQETMELGYCMGPFVDQLLREQDSRRGPTCMISDWTNWWVKDMAAKLGIPMYLFSPNPAAMVQLVMSCPPDGYVFDEVDDDFKQVPGLPPLQKHHVVEGLRNEYEYHTVFLSLLPRALREADGLLVNTCLELESHVIDALRDTLPRPMPVLAVGPLGLSPELPSKSVSIEGLQLSDEKLMTTWLNEQPPLSVLYVSFGTTGLFSLAKRHLTELARGLEASEQRFLWTFRAPPGVDEADPDLLPAGFEERVKGRGLLLRGWAPQLQILAHPSTGAFLSSCGWNSAVESLTFGVPVIGWPSFVDQPLTSRTLEVIWKVGITLPYRDGFFVEAEEFVKAINVVLQSQEGKDMRQKIGKYRTRIGAAIAVGGASHEAILEIVNLIKGGQAVSL